MGTKKGMVRKTARKAYVKKAGSGYGMKKAKSGVKKARNSARMNRLEELGRIDAEKKNKNRMAEKRRVVRELNAKKGKKVVKKAGYGMKKAKAGLKKPKSSQKGLKSLPTAVRNKMGFAKKGGSTRKCKSGCK